jgi:hypothetical protein
MPWRILLCLSLCLVATAQPKLTATSATSKQTILSWTSAEPGPLVVERKPQGAAKFDVITTIRDAASAYADATIDPMTIYQYRVRAEAPASKPSNEVTVGPPATGYSVALATPKVFIDKERPGNFAKSIAMQLDSSGDPAFIYSLIDPRFQDNNDVELWFLHWDRARWQWKPPVKVAGYTVYRDGVSLAGNGGSVWTTVTESEKGIELYLSTDDGMTWTRKHGLAKPDVTILGRAVALSADQVFWVYAVNSDGVYLLSSLTTDDPQKWKTEKLPFAEPVIFGAAAVDLSIAVDSQGRPGLTYFGYGPDYNVTALYWRPGESKSRRIQDSDGVQNEIAGKTAQ